MYDLIIKNGHVVDPINHIDAVMDVAIENGQIAEVAKEINAQASEVLDASGKIVMPGIIDMHTHMRTLFGHPHAQRMVALAGVTTTLDMAGPLEDILNSIPGSGAGVNIAVLEAAQAGVTISSGRPEKATKWASTTLPDTLTPAETTLSAPWKTPGNPTEAAQIPWETAEMG